MGNGLAEKFMTLNEIKDKIDTVDKYYDAIDRAVSGKEPFPPSKDIEIAFKNIDNFSTKLENIGYSGIGEPEQYPVHIDDIANIETRELSILKYKVNVPIGEWEKIPRL